MIEIMALFKKKKVYLLAFLAVLGLWLCTWAFPSCSEQGLLFTVYFTGAQASHCSEISCSMRAQ